jgi:hypothetical protein
VPEFRQGSADAGQLQIVREVLSSAPPFGRLWPIHGLRLFARLALIAIDGSESLPCAFASLVVGEPKRLRSGREVHVSVLDSDAVRILANHNAAMSNLLTIWTRRTWMRVASILSFVFAAGHSFGGTQSWSPAGETDVLRAMRSCSFDTAGFSRTYWDFYFGFGLIISLSLIVQASVLWQLPALSKAQPALVRPIVIVFIAASLVSAGLSWMYLFATPAVFAVLIAVSLSLAPTAPEG